MSQQAWSKQKPRQDGRHLFVHTEVHSEMETKVRDFGPIWSHLLKRKRVPAYRGFSAPLMDWHKTRTTAGTFELQLLDKAESLALMLYALSTHAAGEQGVKILGSIN